MTKAKWSFPVHLFSMFALLFNVVGLSAPQTVHASPSATVTTPYPILFVTQLPVRADFTTIGSVFGNHLSDVQSAGRGGDLWIRYTNGTLKNLTQAAGKGSTGAGGFQDHNAIAVRDPSVYWDGTKALFSMVVGAPDYNERYLWENYYWQIYEITGLGQAQTPVITKVPNQPANFNNVSPIYGTDDRIIFTSDRPRNGAANLYPQLDEYEEAPTVTGLWSIDPTIPGGNLFMLNHAPSGDFTPILDSFGRVIFTQWDHMQRDQQADADKFEGGSYGTFNWSSEAANALAFNSRAEIYPEPRAAQEALPNLNTFTFNQFFPWEIDEDGTAPETLNHIGRHELSGYFPQTFNNDPNLIEYYGQISRFNKKPIDNLLQIKEDPLYPGKYFGVDAPEFRTHASGQIVSLTAPPSLDADHIAVTYITHRSTASFDNPGPNQSGHYRDPQPLSDGQLIAAHTSQVNQEANSGASIYNFRLKTVTLSGNGFYVAGQALTSGISKTISYWDPDNMVNYSGPLWELQPVEVRARTRPTKLTPSLGLPEQQVFSQAGVDVAQFQAYMQQHNIALIVSHNVTTRDDFDRQQPFNLHIPGGVQTLGAGGKIYDIKYLQLFQADQIRGLDGPQSPAPGRRVLAQLMHDTNALDVQPPSPGGPASSVILGTDGSMAAFVPARRAMTWQITGPTGVGVVRERMWLTFQPGEIRVCTSCHGVNDKDQAGHAPPTNQPQALNRLLQYWKNVINAPLPMTLNSVAANDGWILESGENSNLGGVLNNTATIFQVGDDAANKQYRSILHFDTSALPDTAVITSVTLKIKTQGQIGTNPFTTHGGLLADIRKTFFGTTMGLQIGDFQAGASSMGAATFDAAPVGGWYSAALKSTGYSFINLTGTTQFRLRFTLDDNNDHGADYMRFYSGNAAAALGPQLIVKYYVP
jgi:hypothetical protein